MIASLKSEIRKLLTVRSTYTILFLCLVLEGMAAGYGGGFNASAQDLSNPGHLAGEITSVAGLLSAFIPLIAILLVTHEFRYNTITYTLTAARMRSQVLLSKFIVITGLVLLSSVFFAVLAPLFVMAGVALGSHTMAHQVIPYSDLIPKVLFTAWTFSMFGLIISLIARVQVAAIVTYFLIPSTVEPLLAIILKKKQDYLPYISVDGVINNHSISHVASAVAATVWVVVGAAVAWVLFLKRDAN